MAVSAIGLAATGIAELLIAVLTGSVGLLGDAIHNLSDVSTSAVVFLGFRLSRRGPTERYPYGLDRAENRPGSASPWSSGPARYSPEPRASASCSRTEPPPTSGSASWGRSSASWATRSWPATSSGPARRIRSATLIADARHSWLDALSSAGALAGLVAVALGQRWGDPVAGIAVTLFICHVGYEVSTDVVTRLADGVDPDVITAAESAAGELPGVIHAHARARWTGRILRVEIEAWVDPGLTAREADALGRQAAQTVASHLPDLGSFAWTTRAAPD